METQDCIVPNLPIEVWEQICDLCADQILYIILPIVSRAFRKILHDEGAFWKQRCTRKNLEIGSKPTDKSWKHYYRYSIRLFPFNGITIRQTTYQEVVVLKKTNNITLVDDKMKCAALQPYFIVWCRLDENGKFNCVSSITGLKRGNPIPEAWAQQGITWSRSYNQYKELFANWNNNYSESTNTCFVGAVRNIMNNTSLNSVVRESDDIYYEIVLDFCIQQDQYDRSDTLMAISLLARATVEDLKQKAELWHVNTSS